MVVSDGAVPLFRLLSMSRYSRFLKISLAEHGVNPAEIIRRALDLYLTVYLHRPRKGF